MAKAHLRVPGSSNVDAYHTALFRSIKGATIKNLTLAGTIEGSRHTAAIVGASNDGNSKIQDCTVTATDNAAAITAANGKTLPVALTGRTLYKDGKWNTICLPFEVTLSGSPLDGNGVEARTVTAASITDKTLNLTFGNAVSTLSAGTPYIIKWESGSNLTETDLVFSNVTISSENNDFDNKVSGDTQVRFMGTYGVTNFDDTDTSVLLMGESNTLYYPLSGASIGACRAYFKIGGTSTARRLTSFNIGFGDEASSISEELRMKDEEPATAAGWYTLDGRKLSQKPTTKGVYINGGRKVVIR